jgi:hypothetical protein
MRGQHKFLCSFWSYGLRETSRVDYTDFEEERLREKRKNVCFHHYIIGGPPQRERSIKRNKNETVFKFLLCHNE